MQTEQLISLLNTIGFIAIVPTVLALALTIYLAARFPLKQMRTALRDLRATEQHKQAQQDSGTPPAPPEVIPRIPAGAEEQLQRLWSRTPQIPAGWTGSIRRC